MKNLTSELIAKAKAAKSAEELLALAKANAVEMTEEEAKTYFEQLNANGILSDDELDAVAGGSFLGISCPDSDEDDTNPLKHTDGIVTGRCSACRSTNIYIHRDPDGAKFYKCRNCGANVPYAKETRAL